MQVAAELLRIGPYTSAEDLWGPPDWQLLLVFSEYMSGLLEVRVLWVCSWYSCTQQQLPTRGDALGARTVRHLSPPARCPSTHVARPPQFLDWFWPNMGWEQHKQAIVLSKRLLQPRSPNTYPNTSFDPQLVAVWQSFTYLFFHGTRRLQPVPPAGVTATAFTSARDWLTKLVGDRGFELEGAIVSSLASWTQVRACPSAAGTWPRVSCDDMDSQTHSSQSSRMHRRPCSPGYAKPSPTFPR
jgi:hypothetical protein